MTQEIIDTLNIEKMALDQALVNSIQQNIELRKIILIKDKMIKDLNYQVQELLTWKNLSNSDVNGKDIIEAAIE